MTKAKSTPGSSGMKGFTTSLVAFGVLFFLYALLFPLYRAFDYVLALLLSSAGGIAILVTVNNRARGNSSLPQEETVAAIPPTGDKAVDELIQRGQEMMSEIRAENALIPDATLSRQMDILERLLGQILRTVSEKPSKAPQIRRFMSYYMPTTLKMLKSYRMMEERQVSGAAAAEARSRISDAMAMVISACEKQLSTLYHDDILDITTDIQVLEQVLKRDGFTETGFASFTQIEEDQKSKDANQQTGGVSQ